MKNNIYMVIQIQLESILIFLCISFIICDVFIIYKIWLLNNNYRVINETSETTPINNV